MACGEDKEQDPRIQGIAASIRVVPDFPKKGIMFQDITTLLLDPKAFKNTVDLFVERYSGKNISVVAGEFFRNDKCILLIFDFCYLYMCVYVLSMVDCSRLHSFLASMLIMSVSVVGSSSFYQLQYGRLWNRNVFSVSAFPLEKLGKACCFLGCLFANNNDKVSTRPLLFGIGFVFSIFTGIEARGFIFGPPIALAIGAKFVPLRKPRKLPGEVISEKYVLEYGTDCLEMHVGAIQPCDRALVVDDLVATGGTLRAAMNLLERAGAEVVECACVIELPELKGRERLNGKPLYVLMESR
ncbi:unnamed protein product [Musa hybrid cultivar]